MNTLTKIVFLDTETTGLILQNKPANEQPRMASLSWFSCYYDSALKRLVDYDESFSDMQTLYCNDVIMNADATKINGLTTEFLSTSETNTKQVLQKFYEDTKDADVFVAHNNAYDLQIILFACIMHKYAEPYSKIIKSTNICTSAHSRNFSFNDTTRYINLRKLYRHLHNEDFANAHTSDADVKALVKCFDKLIKQNEIPYRILENAKHHNNNLMYLHINKLENSYELSMCVEYLSRFGSNSMSVEFKDFNDVLKTIADFADNSNVIVFSNDAQYAIFTNNLKNANKYLSRFGYTLAYVANIECDNAEHLASLHKQKNFAISFTFKLITDNGQMYS
jgi:DNA polymerase III epsilon subunit-like protein